MSRLLIVALALSTAIAGCLQLPKDANAPDTALEGRNGGNMTASEARAESTNLCADRIDVNKATQFCDVRSIYVNGTISGFTKLDVALQTFNGDVTVKPGNEGQWSFVATLKGRGDTTDAAKTAVDSIQFNWSHEDSSGHFVNVVAKHDGNANGLAAAIELHMPPSLIMTLVGTTSNGDVSAASVRTDGLALTTSNGNVVATADVSQVALTTSNGKIDATLTPSASGRWALTTSNGDIMLKAAEAPSVGYNFEATTSNGEVSYSMHDGQPGACPQGSQYYTPPCTHRTFETNGFGGRSTQVYGTLTTSNGKVSVSSG